jgi:hypothetical protein
VCERERERERLKYGEKKTVWWSNAEGGEREKMMAKEQR